MDRMFSFVCADLTEDDIARALFRVFNSKGLSSSLQLREGIL